jgi:hypothetical protein
VALITAVVPGLRADSETIKVCFGGREGCGFGGDALTE